MDEKELTQKRIEQNLIIEAVNADFEMNKKWIAEKIPKDELARYAGDFFNSAMTLTVFLEKNFELEELCLMLPFLGDVIQGIATVKELIDEDLAPTKDTLNLVLKK